MEFLIAGTVLTILGGGPLPMAWLPRGERRAILRGQFVWASLARLHGSLVCSDEVIKGLIEVIEESGEEREAEEKSDEVESPENDDR